MRDHGSGDASATRRRRRARPRRGRDALIDAGHTPYVCFMWPIWLIIILHSCLSLPEEELLRQDGRHLMNPEVLNQTRSY